jgi:beta-glucosidase
VAANPRTVVVVNAGAAVDLPWADDVPAILQWWFPGMAGGEALARVLVGDVDPGGRLPMTVPFDVADAPCDISHADPPGQLRYTEGLDVGHRWYLSSGITPRWWFGHGLSYAPCSWGRASGPARWEVGDEPILLRVPVTNPGHRAGTEVVQAYLRRPGSSVDRPAWVFGGSTKVEVGPSETVEVDVAIDPATLRHWDVDGSAWAIEPGPLEVRIARSAGDPGDVVTVEIVEPLP